MTAIDEINTHLSMGAVPLVRLDFTDDLAWQTTIAEAADPANNLGDPFWALRLISDPAMDGQTWQEVIAGVEVPLTAFDRPLAFATTRTFLASLRPLLLLPVEPKATVESDGFWCAAASLAGVQANMLASNTDWNEYHDLLEDGEVFVG